MSEHLLRTFDKKSLRIAAGLESETAIVLASALRWSSADGLQYGHRESIGLRAISDSLVVVQFQKKR